MFGDRIPNRAALGTNVQADHVIAQGKLRMILTDPSGELHYDPRSLTVLQETGKATSTRGPLPHTEVTFHDPQSDVAEIARLRAQGGPEHWSTDIIGPSRDARIRAGYDPQAVDRAWADQMGRLHGSQTPAETAAELARLQTAAGQPVTPIPEPESMNWSDFEHPPEAGAPSSTGPAPAPALPAATPGAAESAAAPASTQPAQQRTSWPMAGESGENLRLSYPEQGGAFRYEQGPQPERNPFADLSDAESEAALSGMDAYARGDTPAPGSIVGGEMQRVDMTRFEPSASPDPSKWRSPLTPPGPAAYGTPLAPDGGPYHGAMGTTGTNAKGEPTQYHAAEDFGVTPDHPAYAVRVGPAGSYVDHVFNTQEEAVAYAQMLSQRSEAQIRRDSALPHAWPADKAGNLPPGNPVDAMRVFEIPPNTPFLRSGIAPQPESLPGAGLPASYAGGGPQIQLPYGTLTSESKPIEYQGAPAQYPITERINWPAGDSAAGTPPVAPPQAPMSTAPTVATPATSPAPVMSTALATVPPTSAMPTTPPTAPAAPLAPAPANPPLLVAPPVPIPPITSPVELAPSPAGPVPPTPETPTSLAPATPPAPAPAPPPAPSVPSTERRAKEAHEAPDMPGVERHHDQPRSGTLLVNPNYPPPPGTPQQLSALQQEIAGLLAARAHAEESQRELAAGAQQHQANQAPIAQAVQGAAAGITATQAHREAIARREATNREQQQRQAEASGLVAGYPSRAAGLTALTLPLRAFRGMMSLGRYLPASAEAPMTRMGADATRFLDALAQVDATMNEQNAAQPARQVELQGNAARLQQTTTQAAGSQADLQQSQDGAQSLQETNAARLAQAAAARDVAAGQCDQIGGEIADREQQAQSLAEQLQVWTVVHKAARDAAVAATQERLRALGYRVIGE
jgi:hypothetical protein